MDDLPIEIIKIILSDAIIYKINNSINSIKNLKLINKKFYKIIKDKIFWKQIIFKLNIIEIYDHNINHHCDLYYLKKIIDFNILLSKVPKELLQIFNKKELFLLPINKSRLNIYFDINIENFPYPIMRGYDINNNLYISFKYKSNYDNVEQIEIIYKKTNNETKEVWSTYGPGQYIFYSTLLDIKCVKHYFFNNKTIDYIKRLKNNNAGIIFNEGIGPVNNWVEDSVIKLQLV